MADFRSLENPLIQIIFQSCINMKKNRRSSKLKTRRKLWLDLHLYLGLFVGAVFVLISLSGSLIVFAAQIDTWLNANIMQVDVPENGSKFRSIEEIITSAKTAIPQGGVFANRLSFPQQAGDVFEVVYNISPSSDNYQIFINPYTAEVLGQRLWGSFDSCCSWHGPLMALIYRFHDSFWLGETGSIFVGFIALLMIISLISGIVLWCPNRNHLKTALTIKRRASEERFNYDLHKVFGVYPAIIMFIMLFTGAYLSFEVPFVKQIHSLVSLFSPLTEKTLSFHRSPTVSNLNHAHITVSQAVDIANQTISEGVITTVFFPTQENEIFKIFKHQGNKILFSSKQQMIVVDAHNGEIIYHTDKTKQTLGDIFDKWQLSLHSGEAFGLTGQLMVFFVGLVPLILYVTGIIRWKQKRRVTLSKKPLN